VLTDVAHPDPGRADAPGDHAADQTGGHVAGADKADDLLSHLVCPQGLAGRGPNRAVPIRIWVAPARMATSKSSLMPMESVSRPGIVLPRDDSVMASRRNAPAPRSALSGRGMAISPRSRSRGRVAITAARTGTCS